MAPPLRLRSILWLACAALAVIAATGPATAQRAIENAYASAEDAFGTHVGSEGVGLYSSRDARGFDPTQAGNLRVEGLYFDQQATIGMRLQRSQTMHVGIAAQSYPFPAPTGIADNTLILPGDKRITSVSLQYQDRGGASQQTVDISTPLTDTLGFVGGGTYVPSHAEWGAHSTTAAVAGLFRWRPSDNIEVIPLGYYTWGLGGQVQPLIFSAGAYLPPAFHRRPYFGQTWATNSFRDFNLGFIARATPFANWRLQMDLIRSDDRHLNNHSIFYRNTQTDGTASLDILSYPTSKSASTSGEVRASGIYTQGSYRHTIHLAVRGRDTERLFGGASTVSFGPATIGVYKPIAEPTYTFGTRDKDVVRQITPGVAYVGQWAGVGEFSVGLQKSFYHRDFGAENVPAVSTSSQPWLYNGTVTINATPHLAFYASTTRGLEEFGIAPDNAANRHAPVPADLTAQKDAGLRYRIMPGLNFLAGVFEVKKPYFDRDPANVYTRVGDRSHRGIEMSLTGQLVPNLTIVAGAVLIKGRVTGSSVDRGLIGRIPPGLPPAVYTLSLQYGPPRWHGLSIDGVFKESAASYANRLDTFKIPSATTLDAGLRYSFRMRGFATSLRAQVFNVTDAYDWKTDPASGSIYPTPPRRYALRLAADF